MLDVSDRFRAAMVESHRVSIAAQIWPAAAEAYPVDPQPISGSLKLDRDARVRRSASIVVGFELEANLDFLRNMPFGDYVTLERGVLYPDGTLERPQVAKLRVETVSWSELEGSATIELADRMAQVQDEPFAVPWAPVGLRPSDAIVDAVYQVFGDSINYSMLTDPTSEPPILVDTVYDQDRAQAISDLASSIAATAYFDADGDFVLEPNPGDPADEEPVWELEVGEGGTLEEVQENLDRSAVRNGVAVRGQPSADLPPIYSLAVDDDPDSPTRWGGPFGKVALVVSLQSVQTQQQADSTAASLLNLRLGLARAITFRGVPMPALEPDDVFLACYLDGREELLRIRSIALPLDVTGSAEYVTSGHYTGIPDAETFAARRLGIRVVGGAKAWRELDDAVVVRA